MRVEQAIYGEVDRGHGLRAATTSATVTKDIASGLDLPDTVPPGVDWSPYVSGFAHGQHYVLAKTSRDDTASRSGMVISHALIMPLEEAVHVRNLQPLFDHLNALPVDLDQFVGFDYIDAAEIPPCATDLAEAAAALATPGSGPVVRVGIEAFHALVVSIWSNLWPELRLTFKFRLSFGPADVVTGSMPTLVCTPTTLQGRWSSYRIVGQCNQHSEAPVARLLMGKMDAAPLLSFAAKFGAAAHNLADINLIESTRALLAAPEDLDDLIAAIRLIERLSPNAEFGDEAKATVLAHATEKLHYATPKQVMSVRNLEFRGFPTVVSFWHALNQWVVKHDFSHEDDVALSLMLSQSDNPNAAVESWRRAISSGFNAAANSTSMNLSCALWRWLVSNAGLPDTIFGWLLLDPAVELRLAQTTPAVLSKPLAESILSFALKRKWLFLHGAVLATMETPINAVRRQIAVTGSSKNLSGVEFALRLATPSQLLECAVVLAIPKIVALAAHEVVKSPTLFSQARCVEVGEQMVWDSAMRLSKAIWQAPSNSVHARNEVFDGLVKGNETHVPLIESLSTTPLADLCEFDSRANIWPLLNKLQHIYLQATAAGWVKRALTQSIPFDPDPILSLAILSSPSFETLLATRSADTSSLITVFQALPSVTEAKFLEWLRIRFANRTAFTINEANVLGRLVLARSWKQVVKEMEARQRTNSKDMLPALNICSPMLNIFSKWTLGIGQPSLEQKWESWGDLAAELYPGGPATEAIWSRSGGNESDLSQTGSGRARWHDAIVGVRNGRGPTSKLLLATMVKDFPGNDQLRILSRDLDIVGIGH